MGGYPVPPEIEELIKATWLDMKEKGYEPVAKELLASVRHYLHLQGKGNLPLPKLRKVQLILSEVREEYSRRPDDVKLQDKPWTMATLSEYELPTHAIPYVLQVWRYSINLDVRFTIRQAKWVSRLYAQVPDITQLWFQSLMYTHEEELSSLTGQPMKIYILDGRLVMGDWEFNTTLGTDILKPDIIRYIFHTLKPIASDGGIAEELLKAIPMTFSWEPQEESEYKRQSELHSLIMQLPSSTNYFPDIESRMVYLRHLSYTAKGPQWNTLPPKEILDIIVELRKWVIDTRTEINEDKTNENSNDSLSSIERSFRTHRYPLHLYDRAGYNFTHKGETK